MNAAETNLGAAALRAPSHVPSPVPSDPSAPAAAGAKCRVFIVDDHVLIRYGLSMVIAAEADMEVCGEAEDAAKALQLIIKLQPDVVIADISLKGNSGLELIKGVRAYNPDIRILVISMHPESVYGLRAMKAGARGYIMKQDACERVIAALRRVRDGGVSVSDSLAMQMLHGFASRASTEDTSLAHLLSDRELEIVDLIGNGLTTREIALKLHVSVKTIETHRAHIKGKLNLQNFTQLVQTCVRLVEENRSGVKAPANLGAA